MLQTDNESEKKNIDNQLQVDELTRKLNEMIIKKNSEDFYNLFLKSV